MLHPFILIRETE